jgi:hypothetical protein
LRNRGGGLLATATDPGKAIFSDIGLLYGLRSNLVHGGSVKETAHILLCVLVNKTGDEFQFVFARSRPDAEQLEVLTPTAQPGHS